MRESTEQRICIKFCFKIGKPQRKTLQQAYGEDAVWVVHNRLTGSVDLKTVEPPIESDPPTARDDRKH